MMSQFHHQNNKRRKQHPKVPSSPAIVAPDFDYTAVTRSPLHKWTTEQRTTLCVLHIFYNVSWLDTKLIFNALFAEELPFPRGLSRGALSSMYFHLRKGGFQPSGRWMPLRKAIEAKASELGVQLSPEPSLEQATLLEATKCPQSFGRKLGFPPPTPPNTLRVADEVDSLSDSDDTLVGDDELNAYTPTKSNGHLPAKRSLEIPDLEGVQLPKKPVRQDKSVQRAMPRVAFRA